ncbi:MAG TPA: peptidoglycan-binding domain-containing protein [Streptosporangiaceae bacterium]|nr:peptidoglycan-binding domain-containing protein [Streptosporangiaceae bacterium]
MHGGPGAGSKLDPFRTRRFFLGGVAVGVIAMSAAGLAAAWLIESPSQLAARTAAPDASVITGTVELRVLRDPIMLPGLIRPGHTVTVRASAPYSKITVTKMRARLGGRVRPGHVLAELDGRPVVLLAGTLAPYRDLHEGDTGPDVVQLQKALASLGYGDYDPAGFFGWYTSQDLVLLYQRLGYSAPMYRPPVKKPRQPGVPAPLPTAYLPMSEVSYIPSSSALVILASARAGTVLAHGHALLKLATGNPYVTGIMPARQVHQARIGLRAQIAAALPRLAASGVIAKITQVPAYAGHGPGHPWFQVVVTAKRPIPVRMVGTKVRLTLWVPVSEGPVLTVPLAGVFSGQQGRPPYVVRIAADGQRQEVAVHTGLAADGLVAVSAVRPGSLSPATRVLIGVGK